MTIHAVVLENHCITMKDDAVMSVTSVITGRFVKHSIGYMLLAAKARVEANNELLERLNNQAYVLNKNTASTAFNDIIFIKQSLTPLFNIVMTMFCLILRCLYATKHVAKKHTLDIIDYVLDVNTIDIVLVISCIVLFVLIMF